MPTLRKRKPIPKVKEQEAEELAATDGDAQTHTEELKAETDELTDEIDSILEENAQDFVRAYVQKGGQAVEVLRSLWDYAKRGFQLLPSLPQPKWTGIQGTPRWL